jgi:AcrR family transcriptional regulator
MVHMAGTKSTDKCIIPGKRERNKDAVRARIVDEVINLISSGRADINHDLVAENAGVGRRTVYRYFPDRESLLQCPMDRVRELAGGNMREPQSEEDLVGFLYDIHTGFDRVAPIATMMRTSPQGRAMRMAANKRRVESYSRAAADAVKDLPEEDRTLATAMLQVLHTTPWLEMRDHWGLTGEQIARACGWAMRTLLADLHARGGTPLDQPT